MKRLLVLLLGLAALPSQLKAVPAFARMTGNSCAYCHALPTLQLTAEGIKFERNGMRAAALKFSGDDQKLDNYASLILEYEIDAFRTNPATSPSVQATQPVFSILTGGPLSDHFSYKATYHFNESSDSTANLEEAYLQYNTSVGEGTLLTIRGGQFNPILLRSFGLGTTSYVEGSLVLNNTVSDASPYALSNALTGVDANLYWGNLEASVGLSNPTTGSAATNPTNRKDTYADVYWNIDSLSSGIGLFRYDGTNLVFTTPGDPTTPLLYQDKFDRNGILLRYAQEKWRVSAAAFQGAHTTDALGTRTKNLGWYGLAEANFNEHFGIFARYDKLSPDRSDPTLDTKMALIGFNGFLFRTPKSGGRWVLETSETENAGIKNYQTLAYVVVAF